MASIPDDFRLYNPDCDLDTLHRTLTQLRKIAKSLQKSEEAQALSILDNAINKIENILWKRRIIDITEKL